MKTLLVTGLILLGASVAFSQVPPDPRDSVIIESKYATPGKGACQSAFFRVRIWITNKDSLGNITLPLLTQSLSGGAYAILSRQTSCGVRISPAVFNVLLPPPQLPTRVSSFAFYHSNSPDTFMFTGTFDPTNDTTAVPPNLTRTPLLDIKFDSVTGAGQFQVDSTKILASTVQFVGKGGNTIFVNFVKSIVTVIKKGDLDLDGNLTSADVVLMLNGVFCSGCEPPLTGRYICDMNCDGMATSADVVLHLNATYLGFPFPC